MSHPKKCVCDYCRDEKAAIAKAKQALAEYGWYIHYVFDDNACPNSTNIHTHGLPDKYNHKDLQICFPVGFELAGGILHAAVNLIAEGVVFQEEVFYEKILNNYTVKFIAAIECRRPVMRMILPDSNGKLAKPGYAEQLFMLTNSD